MDEPRPAHAGCADLLSTLAPRAVDCRIPLTAAQRHWLVHIGERQGGLGNRSLHLAVRLLGPLDVELLRRSMELVVARHESLRTRIAVDQHGLLQHIETQSELELSVIEPPGSSASEVTSRALQLGREFVATSVDPSLEPLFAAKLFRCSAREHLLVLGSDHLVSDLASNAILHDEIWTHYRCAFTGAAPSLPKLPVQYADYAVWQEFSYYDWLAKHEAYWRRRLAGAACTRLPSYGGPAERSCDPCPMTNIPLGVELSDQLRDFARRERTLLSLVALSIYVATLSSWTEQRDLVIKFVSHGRYGPQLRNMVGFIAATLHLRIEIADDDTFLTLVRKVQRELSAAYWHRDFDRVPDLIPECTTEWVFNWMALPGGQQDASEHPGGLEVQPFLFDLPFVRPVFATFSDTAAGVVASVFHRPDASGRRALLEFGGVLRACAEQLVQRPTARVAALSDGRLTA